MANRIQLRRDTTANWENINPILADGEPGYDIDNNQIKYGDGNTNWNSLPYQFPSGGIIMWSGAVVDIPQFWVLCDGTHGTPDLRNRFVVGAGDTYSVGNTGGSANAIVVSHSHSITDSGHKHWISGGQKDDGNFTSQGGTTQEYGLWSDGGTYSTEDPDHTYGRNSKSASTGISVNSTGDSGTNANLPPYYALCFIMKT